MIVPKKCSYVFLFIARFIVVNAVITCSAGGFRRDEWIFPSVVQAAILNYKNSGELGRGKKFTKSVGGRNSPSLQRIQNGGLTLER